MKKNIQATVDREKSMVLCILKGLGTALIISIALLLIFTGISMAAQISDALTKGGCMIIMLVSVICGAVQATGCYKSRGLIVGGITGILYIVMMLIFASVLNQGLVFSRISISVLCFGFIAGAIGGIVKINLQPKRR